MMEYLVKFIYEGVEPIGFWKPFIEQRFSVAYHRYCEQTNPQLERWNSEYEKLGLEDTMTSLDENNYIVPEHPYNKFMRKKCDNIAKTISEFPFRNFQVGEEIDFEGVLLDGTKMSFVLVPRK